MKFQSSGQCVRRYFGFGLLVLISAPLVGSVTPGQESTKLPGGTGVVPDARWTTYCESTPNSTGVVGTVHVAGSLSVSLNDTVLASDACPPGEYGVFIYGLQPAQLSWGNGVLCISPYSPGVLRLHEPAIIPPSGYSEFPLDLADLPIEMQILPGMTGYFQCLFRDPTVGERFNLSNAVAITFGA